MWSQVSALTFSETSSSAADIEISFGAGYHGDLWPFDGPGNTLAHVVSPGGRIGAHFDEDETWTNGSYRGLCAPIYSLK